MPDAFRYAARRLLLRPGFTLAAGLALALGIGCTTAIFSVLQAALFKVLPVPEADRVVSVWEAQPGFPDAPMSGPDFRDLRAGARSFDSLSAYAGLSFRITGLDRPEVADGEETGAGFFQALRAKAVLGRLYGPGSSGEVVLSERLWRRVFGADPRVLGRSLSLNGEPRTIVGVLASGFEVPDRSELWVSTIHELPTLPGFLDGLTVRDASYLKAVARLRPGVSLAQAQAELDAISSRLTAAYPDTNQGHLLRAATLQSTIVGDAKEPLLLLLGGVLLVLLIACANVSGLQLARGAAGERDLAVRAALGASRARLVKQLLIESTVLALFGGALGLLASVWGVKLLVGLAGSSLPRSAEVTLDGTVLAFTAGLSMLSGVASGLLPALFASRPRSIAALRTGAPAAGQSRLRGALVTVEVALAFMLLTGAALLIRSFERLREVDPGFRSGGVIVLPLSHDEQGAAQFHAEMARRASSIPGVLAAGSVFRLPMGPGGMTGDITPEGSAPRAGDYLAATQIVAGDYFRALGIPLLQGRGITSADTKSSARVAVVNQAFAKRFFPGAEVLGKRFCWGVADAHTTEWFSVVGVVGDVRQISLAQPAQPEAYYALEQAPTPPVEMTLVARTDLGFASFLHALQAQIDPDQPLTRASTLEETVSTTLRRRRLSMVLLAAFSGCALLLAVLGIYATLAFSVVQRTREIGVRMALGAAAGSVVRLVVLQGMRLALLGALLGIAGALAAGRLVAGLLYGVGAHDPATFALVAGLLLLAALFACWIPAWRAARVDPLIALKTD